MNKEIMTITHIDSNSQARRGTLHLPHGTVQTPAFMPVGTNATIKAISHKQVERMNYEIILANNYHLYLRPGEKVIDEAGGLHNFSAWSKNILTDSGGFQLFSLPNLRKISDDEVKFQSHIDGSHHVFTPEKVVSLQETWGSDIQMVLDICTPPEISHDEALKAVNITTQWAARAMRQRTLCKESYEGKLFLIIQGNFFEDLRKQSVEQLLALDSPGIAIGGLSVGEEKSQYRHFLAYTASLLPPEKPRYVMGIGTPDYIFDAVENGIDVFDCVYPTRVARNGVFMTRNGLLNLKNERFKLDQSPIEEHCPCDTCQNYSRSYIRHLFVAKEIYASMLATQHNLMFMATMMQEMRESIVNDTFMQYKKEFLFNYYQGKESV